MLSTACAGSVLIHPKPMPCVPHSVNTIRANLSAPVPSLLTEEGLSQAVAAVVSACAQVTHRLTNGLSLLTALLAHMVYACAVLAPSGHDEHFTLRHTS